MLVSAPITGAAAPVAHDAAAAAVGPLADPGLRERVAARLDRYYAPTDGLVGAQLLHALHEVVSSGPRAGVYERAREVMFAKVDDPTGRDTVVDLYTGRAVSGVRSLATATARGLTAEHAWPQSRGATDEARADLHALFPVDGEVNTMRSNIPYGEVDVAKWSSPSQPGVREPSLIGLDEAGRKVFEPRASMRGDVARAQLYFFTRWYEDRPDGFRLDDFAESLPTLLRWHQLDPPSPVERLRNHSIHAAQGNRNPFVDHPALVDRIGFDTLLRPHTSAAASS